MDLASSLWLIPALPLAGFLANGTLALLAGRRTAAAAAAHTDHGARHAQQNGHSALADGHSALADGHSALADGDSATADALTDPALPAPAHGHDEPVWPNAALVAAIGVAGPLLAFVLSVLQFRAVVDGRGMAHTGWTWIRTGSLEITAGLQVDALTATMLLFVTGIGTLIHVYSYGYMGKDPGVARFFAYLNLFMTSMLVLVLGDSLPLLFVGWEGVGLCSYLLIGFWTADDQLAHATGFENVDAGRKAFVVNRIGDLGFLLGMFVLYGLVGSLGFGRLEEVIGPADPTAFLKGGPFGGWSVESVLSLAAVFLFVGATGKSAQIPLYVWLPDAMAGPTPVSALIHAATMVTAGVYMIGRLDFLFVHVPAVMAGIAIVAACTALLSGTIAVAQYDIKKVLAYSTVSQLGFMFCGMATTLWVSGLFHVVTHAFFKALLFLGAGAVIHALHGEQDIRKMGGLAKDLKAEFVLFAIGAAALAGVPPFAGFYSKDAILGNVHLKMVTEGGPWFAVFAILVVTAGLTAFYTTRLVVLTFFGPPADPHRHPHPNHWTILLPLVVLAALSLGGGWYWHERIETFTAPVWTQPAWLHAVDHEVIHHSHTVAQYTSIAVAGLGILGSLAVYLTQRGALDAFVRGPGASLHALVHRKFLVDELYQLTILNPLGRLAEVLFAWIDRALIDSGLVEGSGRLAVGAGAVLRRTQAAAVNAATATMVVGAIGILAWFAWVRG